MEAQITREFKVVPKNNVLPFVPRDPKGGYFWHCHEVGCAKAVYGRYESAAAYDIAKHWTDEHDPRDAA